MTNNDINAKSLPPAGNVYNKYESKNPIVKRLMTGFTSSLHELLALSNASDIHEIGCGEGYLSTGVLSGQGRTVRGSDLSAEMVDSAKSRAISLGIPPSFKVSSIYDLKPDEDSAELIVCCEVLEHLDRPDLAIELLSRLAKPYLIVSVPREPVWRILNLMRAKYITSLGNTPGHIQHWSKAGFLGFIGKYLDIIRVLSPLPWTMALCRKR